MMLFYFFLELGSWYIYIHERQHNNHVRICNKDWNSYQVRLLTSGGKNTTIDWSLLPEYMYIEAGPAACQRSTYTLVGILGNTHV